jgi:hypothetical protein
MGKTKFVFDNVTGTLRPEANATPKHLVPLDPAPQPSKTEEVSIDLRTPKPNVNLDEPIIQFRQNTDYTIFQVIEERSRKPMMIIGGYGLEIKFNIAELRSTERIEQLLGGLTTMFRKMILEQALSKDKS